jgi:multiple sugar transport system permease protein
MHARRTGLRKYGLVAPVLVILIALNVFPLVYNIVIGFTDADLSVAESRGVGGRNYAEIFTEPGYVRALRTTALFVFAAVSIELMLGFSLALALRRPFAGRTVIVTILLIPMMLSPAVMGLFWNLILNARFGILNLLLGAAGLPQPAWLHEPALKLVSVILIDVWMWTPFMMLIAMAALRSIPDYLYEAAEIDRAGRWRVFRRITLPLCAPLLGLAVLLRVTDALKQFDLVMATTGPNDPATQTLSAMIFQTGFRDFRIGLAAAYACVVLVLVIGLASVAIRYIDHLRTRHGKAAA